MRWRCARCCAIWGSIPEICRKASCGSSRIFRSARVGSQELGTRTEIKNLNSFRALERSVDFEIQRQSELIRTGQKVVQETRGWDESRAVTLPSG